MITFLIKLDFLFSNINNVFKFFRALRFYKRFGFEVVETKEAYYKRIEPADAHVLEKKIDNTISNGTLAIH